MPAMPRNEKPSRSGLYAEDTGGNGCEIDAAGDTVIAVPIGVDMPCPAGWAADSPGCPPGDWRVVCACSAAAGRRQAAAVAVSRGRKESLFIWCSLTKDP